LKQGFQVYLAILVFLSTFGGIYGLSSVVLKDRKKNHAFKRRSRAQYITERLPQLVPGVFDGAPDLPDFTVDQRFSKVNEPPYPV
jgi:hypothetical protein